ncbi:hypothetical protein CDD80_3358 [Ophiocordyceps camponoti-rufipedis]|uniref:Hydrophobin n=1 Tax=Ophiocordyceps camponoti-rufipedis TaxID=2004952 RepID=A0A2C5ZM34_9HYPO|nr:hypothetical protein CDD80_3358 [Ophiocordyceps camponoti-rufipedis]
MVRLLVISALALAVSVNAVIEEDPAGRKNVGIAGAQFIGGTCVDDANCATGKSPFQQFYHDPSDFCSRLLLRCCWKSPERGLNAINTGGVKDVQGLGNQGNQGGQSNDPALARVGKGNRDQFITGPCATNADCTTDCCVSTLSSPEGKCSALAPAKDGDKLGCGTGPGERGLNGNNI